MAEPNTSGAGTLDAAPQSPPAPPSAEIMRIQNDRALQEFASPFASAAAYRHFNEIAKVFAGSIFVPDSFKNKPGECLIAIDIARRMGESELMVMQQMYVVKGRPGFSTKFMIGRANRLAGFKSTIKWVREEIGPPVEVSVERKVSGNRQTVKFTMPNMKVTAWAIDRFNDRIEVSVDTKMAIEEGWVENAKYTSMPEHMFRWRSSSMLINLYAPEVMMGMQTIEELETLAPIVTIVDAGVGGVAGLESRLLSTGTFPAVALSDNGEGEQETTIVVPEGETLTAEQVAKVRELAGNAGVSVQAVEEAFEGPLAEYSAAGRSRDDIFADSLRVITGLVEKAKATEPQPPAESLFDAPSADKAKAKKP